MLSEVKDLILRTYFTVSSTNYAFGIKGLNATYLWYYKVTMFIPHFLSQASKVLIMLSEVNSIQ